MVSYGDTGLSIIMIFGILFIGIRLEKTRFNYKRVPKKESRTYKCKPQTYILEH